MRSRNRWLLWCALPVVLLAGLVWGLQRWATSEGLRDRLASEASAALGAPVRLQRLSLALWPLPALAVDGLRIEARAPLALQRVELRPRWSALLLGRFRVQTLVVREAVLPEATIALISAGLDQRARAARGAGAPGTPDAALDFSLLPRELTLDAVTWLAADGARTTLDASLRFADDGWPARAQLAVVAGALHGTRLALERDNPDTLVWTLQARVGGGEVRGPLTVNPADPGAKDSRWSLQGELQTEGVEVSALTAPSRPLSGRLQARTELRARFPERASADDLIQALRTDTRFSVSEATVHGIDLARAVRTVGLSRGGSTELDTLAGQVSTRGKAITLSNLVASSGVLAATGEVNIAPNRALSGRVRVDLTRGAAGAAVGVPLVVGGTLDKPEVTLTRAALLGAAIGTALMPGVGTGAGANLGDRLGEGLKGLFGGDREGPQR